MGKRTVGLYLVLIVLFTGMMSRLYTLSMGEQLASAANTQSAFVLEADRTRGMIYDCNFQPLVNTQKRTVAAVQPSPEALTALVEANQRAETPLVFDKQATKPFLMELGDQPIYAKNIEMFETTARYSTKQLAPHIIGYMNPERTNGTAGIELAFDELLTQHSGSLRLRYTMDAAGRILTTTVPKIQQTNYQAPSGVVLTLDERFQQAAQDAMKDVEKGAAVVMDVQTGDIKASVSVPAYDPNNLAASLHDPNGPFVNRAFSQYSVGSTFKLVTAAAALEAGFNPNATYTCVGVHDVVGHSFHCHWRLGHGEVNLLRAMEVSCNPYFVDMGLKIGGRRIASMARDLGFTRGAQLAGDIRTQTGTLPGEQELGNSAEVANLSFGQGKLTATPIQIAQMMSAVANGGYAVTPRLVEGFTDNGKTMYERTMAYTPAPAFSKRTSDLLRETMVSNVVQGSGKSAKPYYGTAGGKTASAQTGVLRDPNDPDSEIVHAWFAGYFPAEAPEYAIAVVVEGGNSGSDIAAPIFRRIADEILLAQMREKA